MVIQEDQSSPAEVWGVTRRFEIERQVFCSRKNNLIIPVALLDFTSIPSYVARKKIICLRCLCTSTEVTGVPLN